MKKLIFVVIALLFLGIDVNAQSFITRHNNVSVTVDSNSTGTVYFLFEGRGAGLSGFQSSISSTVTDNPKDEVFASGDLTFYGTIDSSNAVSTSTSDSLSGYALPLGHDGLVMSGDTLWFDFANNTTSSSEVILDWSPANASTATVGMTGYTFWINLTNKFPPCFGFKIVFTQYQASTEGQTATVTLHSAEVGGR